MRGPETLKKAEDNWCTDMGALFNGERVVFRGRDLFTELNDLTWFEYLLFGITGKFYSEAETKFIQKLWTLTSCYPEPRVWNNRVSALTGSARSTGNLGVSASISVSEASIYGNQINIAAFNFIHRAKLVSERNDSLTDFVKTEIKTKRFIAGYGRPIIKTDERVLPLLKTAENLGFSSGPHLKVALQVEKILIKSRYKIHINAGGIAASFMADLGFDEKEHYYCSLLSFSAGIIPCYIDSVKHREGTFFPLRSERLNYTGAAKRHW